MIHFHTENIKPHFLGGLAEAVGGHERVQACVRTFALWNQQRATVIGHYLVDVLVVLNLHPVVRFVGWSLVPGECGEWTATNLGHYTDVGALFNLHELL